MLLCLARRRKSWAFVVQNYIIKQFLCACLISLVNNHIIYNDFQINKCAIILRTVQRICSICYALSILNITYLPYAITNALFPVKNQSQFMHRFNIVFHYRFSIDKPIAIRNTVTISFQSGRITTVSTLIKRC